MNQEEFLDGVTAATKSDRTIYMPVALSYPKGGI
jgi:hypothetical protein